MVKIEINIQELENIMFAFVKKKKPLFIHGAPGIGKSDTVQAVTRKMAEEREMEFSEGLDPKKYSLIDVRISQLDPSDLRGIPFPENGKTKWLTPTWLPDSGEGVIFFDELNLAPPSIQAAAYQLILDRRLGEYTLPEGFTIIAAGNRAIDGANVFSMAAPLKNRFAHVNLLEPSSEMWTNWAMEKDIEPDIVAFIGFKGSLLFKFDKNSKDNAFPTPRTWALASHMIKGIENDDVRLQLVSSCVGEGAALEFGGFMKLKKKVNIADILKNPKKVRDIAELGMKYSLISGLTEVYKNDKKKMPNVLQVVEYIEDEFGVFLLRMMKASNKSFISDLNKTKEWDKLSDRYMKFLC